MQVTIGRRVLPTSHGISAFRRKGTCKLTQDNTRNWVAVAKRMDLTKLASIRSSLIRQEDTIIYSLIERSQCHTNPPTYDAKLLPVPGFEGSLLEYMVTETERAHALLGRYTNPDEHPFFPEGLPESRLPVAQHQRILHKAADAININPKIWNFYLDYVLQDGLATVGNDGNFGSAANCDILCLQALSRRIHFGKFVAEAKFKESPDVFEPLIRAKDSEGLYKLITFESVELNVLRRVENKAMAYGQDVGIDGLGSQTMKIDPKLVGRLYSDWVMPLTKEVEVEYLLRRLD